MLNFGNDLTDYIPILALITGTISVFVETKNRSFKTLLILVLIGAQIAICYLEITKNVKAKNEAEQQLKTINEYVDTVHSSVRAFETATKVSFDSVIAEIRKAKQKNGSINTFNVTISQKRVRVQESIGIERSVPTKNTQTQRPTRLKPVFKEQAKEGYAYYGELDWTDIEDSSWVARYFKNITQSTEKLPKVGDTVEATSDVNIRSGYIEFNPTLGYQNKEIIGLIKSGEKLKVNEVERIAMDFVWINFTRVK